MKSCWIFAFLLTAIFGHAAAPDLRDQVKLNGTWSTGGVVPRYDSQNVSFDFKTYERSVTVPTNWTNKIIKLEFNSVNYYCDVLVNNKIVGSHTGAWVPFSFDITDKVAPGKTFTLTVKVKGKLVAPAMVSGKVVWWIGHNDLDQKRCGIVDDVFLRAYGKAHIEDAFVQTSFRKKEIKLQYTLVNKTGSSWTGKVVGDIHRAADDVKEKTISSNTINLAVGETKTVTLTSSWTNPKLWQPDDPQLYLLKSRLENSSIIDRETRRFGFREFWIEGKEYRLNGYRFNMRNEFICFSQYLGAITTESQLRSWYNMMFSYNMNGVRWHKHPAPKFAYDLADEMGMTVIAETAFYGRPYYMPDQIYDNHTAFINRILTLIPPFVKQLRSNASVVIWSASNEVTYSILGKFDPNLVKKLGDKIYTLDATRPVSYDGDKSVPGVIYNAHYPEGYENNPSGDPYSTWINKLSTDRPTHFGELMAVRTTNDNKWWWGVWPRGLRYLNVSGYAPRVLNKGLAADNVELIKNCLNPLLLTDKAYDKLGIAPFKDGNIPSVGEGVWLERNLVLFNDDYRNTSVTARVEIKVDGTTYATGEKTYNLELGSHRDITAKFQVPKLNGKEMNVYYITKKNGVERFREIRKFNITDKGTSGTTSNIVTLDYEENQSPRINFIQPTAGTSFTEGVNLNAEVNASDSDGSIANVKLYLNGQLVRQENAAPYEWGTEDSQLQNMAAGNYTLKALATDNDGATSEVNINIVVNEKTYILTVNSGSGDGTYKTGTVVNISANAAPAGKEFDKWTGSTANIADIYDPTTIITMPGQNIAVTAAYKDLPVNQAPTVSFSTPVNGASFSGGVDLYVRVNASDTDGSVDNVKLYLNGQYIRQENNSLYEWGTEDSQLQNMAAGNYTLKAIATDDDGATSETNINIMVNQPAYVLTVNNGSGDGNYTAGSIVSISADAAPAGKEFDQWTGSIANIADVNDPTTIITIPGQNISITATYRDIHKVGDLLVQCSFNDGTDGFIYRDDAFRNTDKPAYADGDYDSDAGVLQINVGGTDSNTVLDMSGGWKKTFTLESATEVTIAFAYQMTTDIGYDPEEYVETLFAVDNQLIGADNKDYVYRITGGGNRSWRIFSTVLTMGAGAHTLTIGAYNNKKTYIEEKASILIDEARIYDGAMTEQEIQNLFPTPYGNLLLSANFNDTTDGFVYNDDTFRDTNQPLYAYGSYNYSEGALQVNVGGIDNNTVLDMSGGWKKTFTLESATEVTIVFAYKMTADIGYDPDEYFETLFAVDNQLIGANSKDYIYRITDGGNPDWQVFISNTLTMSAGEHTLTIEAYNNKKSYSTEKATILIDEVFVIAK